MNKPAKQYYKNIRRLFPILRTQEKKYLNFLKKYIEDYDKKHPNATYENYVDFFGEEEKAISSYYEHIESEFIIKHMKSRKLIKYVSIFMIASSLICMTLFFSFLYKQYSQYKNSQLYYETNSIIEYE